MPHTRAAGVRATLDSQGPELVDVWSSGHQGTWTVQAPLRVDAAMLLPHWLCDWG